MDNSLRNKFLCICGVVCAICGLIILAVSVLDDKPAPAMNLTLGGLNLINGCLFLILSRRQKS